MWSASSKLSLQRILANIMHIVSIISFIHTRYTPTAQDPHPFSLRQRDWVRAFVRELVDGISECMTGGVADAQGVVQRFLEQVSAFIIKNY